MKFKKILLFFLILIVVFMSFFCIKLLISSLGGLQGDAGQESLNTSHTGIPNSDTQFTLDIEYQNKMQDSKSNVEITAINDEFSEKWKSKIEFYYIQIVNYYTSSFNQEMHDLFKENHINWSSYAEQQYNYYETVMCDVYTTGSIVPVKLSNYKRTVYRNRAIELYNQCIELSIKVESP